MHDTVNPSTGEVQSMVFPPDYTGVDKDGNSLAGKPKGMEQVLRERSLLSTLERKHRNNLAARKAALKEARSKQDEIEGSGLPAMGARGVSDLDNEDQARPNDCCMQRFRSRADGTFKTAQKLVPECLDAVSLSNIRKYFRHCWRYMSAYRLGLNIRQAAYAVKKYTSHRCVPNNIIMDINVITRGANG
ncbi:hypothetical protein JOM56_010365 [Amanita muscaria]